MLKKLISAFAVILLLGSCTSFKPIAFNSNSSASRQSPSSVNSEITKENKEIKFLDEISTSTEQATAPKKTTHTAATQAAKPISTEDYSGPAASSETENSPVTIQAKYSTLLNTSPEEIRNVQLYEQIDDWYGTPYRMGGSTKSGIDCSAFVQTVCVSAFGASLPRTAREQYKYVKLISSTQLKEGDLLFFNTRGYVSHVGIYLQNNKFVHASVSGGVTISDMFDPYYARHFIGAGRIEGPAPELHRENVYKSPYQKKKRSSKKRSSSKKKK
jgi:cell wall-associated NlpC family hydrolase